MPIFAKHDDEHPAPSVDCFMAKYGHRIPEVQQGLGPLTLKDIKSVLNKLPLSGAGGLDGWTPSDLSKVPDSILELLLLLFDLVESSGEWPAALARAGITQIPKGEEGETAKPEIDYSDSIVYRMWGERQGE